MDAGHALPAQVLYCARTAMAKVEQLIDASSLETMRETIEEARGNEVFFLARLDDRGMAHEIVPLARGHDSAVPALMQVAAQGDVVIHNHPSGCLDPSSPDIAVASELGNRGVGCYIVNNAVDDVYVVVEAFKKQQNQLLNTREIIGWLAREGMVARNLTGFEARREQLRMLAAICHAFNDSKLALIEAGTGTGKSLAYLLPALSWAVRNKQRVVVSTNTINLQEQLLNKDLPLLERSLPFKFKAVLMKGRQNYVCLNKVDNLEKDGEYLIETEERAELKSLLQWAHKTRDGSRSDLSIVPKPSVWEKVACESDNCARVRCSFYNNCFFYNARREASAADLLVANHHLLFADLAVRSETGSYTDAAILPGYSRIILDEAHNVEDVATDYFGTQLSRRGLLQLLGRFYSLREKEKVRERGLLPYLLAKLKVGKGVDLKLYSRIYSHVQNQLLPLRERLAGGVSGLFDQLSAYFESFRKEDAAELKVRFTPEILRRPEWSETVLPLVRELVQDLEEFHRRLCRLQEMLDLLGEKASEAVLSQAVELSALTGRIETAASSLGEIFGKEDESKVRWIEMREGKTGKSFILRQVPLNVAGLLRERFFQKFETVVLTSATLTTENRFSYIRERLGLDGVAGGRLVEMMLPSPFDYARQVILAIPVDIPAPDHPSFAAELGRLVLESIRISEGRALVLFTSYYLLRRTFQELQAGLEAGGIRALMQGDAPRHRLTEVFKQDKTSVLFATDSFWEGVDVAGEALENVIITKLPFSVPQEPVVEARVEAIQRRGGNPFIEYSVPQAVIRFKQGFGRLIRTRTDRGSIMIFDRRILEKKYGRIFLDSLPPCRRVSGGKGEVFNEVREFFAASRR